jgi:pilus assembly protein CpaB
MKPLVLIIVALGCGLVAAVGVFQHINSSAAQQVQSLNVVVATKEIRINEAFSEENVQIVEWPGSQVPEGAISDFVDVEGMYARARLYPGEPILHSKMMDESDVGSSRGVPAGYRVVSVKVSLDSSVSNLIEPGDLVDVIAVLRESRKNPVAMAKTILTGVRVFAVNSDIVRSLGIERSPDEARAVSLLLKPDEAEKLMMANELGTIKLAMRRPDDEKAAETMGCTLNRVLGTEADDGAITDFGSGQHYWTMLVTSPGAAQKYTWATPNAMPQMEVLYSLDDNSNSDSSDLEAVFGELDDDIEVTDYSDGEA